RQIYDSAFARFNTIITSLKALDESFSSKNYVRKFLRDLHPKWRAKVMAIEESKDLTSLSLDELIKNLKVHKMIIKKDSKIVKEKVDRKSLTLKAKKESSDEECSTSGSEDEEHSKEAVMTRTVKVIENALDAVTNHLIGECPKALKDKNQRAFVGGSWSDSGEEDDEKGKDETCLVAHASNKDSGCSKHMTGNRNLFFTYKAYNGGNVIFGSNLRGNIIGKGKQAHTSHKAKNIVSTTRCLELLHMNLFVPSVVRSYGGNRYILVTVDDYSREVEESLNVTFNETPPPSKTPPLVDDDLDEDEAIKSFEKENQEKDIVDETLEIDEIVNIKESKNHSLENVMGNINQRTLMSQSQNQSNFFYFISTIEPKNINEALGDKSWIVAMQE
nr:alpha/beta hydrolases superfamily protein [Tanacetum cinerariifolium]